MIKEKNLHPTLRDRILGIPRRAFHVCKADANNADFLYDSIDSGRLFHTILEAMAVAQDHDDIIVWPGTWVEDATIDFGTKHSIRILAADFGIGHGRKNTHIRQYNGTNTPVFTVNGAHNIEIAGFRISPYDTGGGAYSNSIEVGQTVWTHGVYIHDNYFSFYLSHGQGVLLGAAGGAGTEATDAVVQNNTFVRGGNGAAANASLQMHDCPRAQILNNKFDMLGTHGLSIKITPLAATHYRAAWICDNYFINSDGNAGCVGIETGTKYEGVVMITGNHFVNYADHTACINDADEDNLGLNYLAHAVISSLD